MIVDYLKGDESAKKIISKNKKAGFYITEISIYEVLDGIYRRKSKKEFDLFISFISNFNIIPTTTGFALDSARIAAELRKKGITIEDSDLLIAGMMRSYGFENIITRNKKHFSQIKGIKVVSY